jgi:hypothetical protein
LRFGVETALFGLLRPRDEDLGLNCGVCDLGGAADVVVEVAEGILGSGEARQARLGALISLEID